MALFGDRMVVGTSSRAPEAMIMMKMSVPPSDKCLPAYLSYPSWNGSGSASACLSSR